jgi:hypothetical protein
MFAPIRTFRCPNCNEMINDTMSVCRFCAVPVDPGVAALVAERQEKANQACSDASFLRTTALAMFVFLGVSFIPLIPLVYWGFLVTFIALAVMLIRWQVKFSSLLTNDPDYKRARGSWMVGLVLWFVAIPVGFVMKPLFDLIVTQFL